MSLRMSHGLCLLVAVCLATACTPTRMRADPPFSFESAVLGSAELQAAAAARCLDRSVDVSMLHAFTTDGCSLWPDASWRRCCIEHDVHYWCGGGAAERRAVDRALRQCVQAAGSPAAAALMYWGVRTGGHPWLPFPWRWGYGADYFGDER